SYGKNVTKRHIGFTNLCCFRIQQTFRAKRKSAMSELSKALLPQSSANNTSRHSLDRERPFDVALLTRTFRFKVVKLPLGNRRKFDL
ncbi:MAG: hypothetical protein LBT09_11565, partial [Planctomycetaceae bacterium]|nr:hypothetical protein [Planctomycetaceae bacterium]